jgi:hypothetical protein
MLPACASVRHWKEATYVGLSAAAARVLTSLLVVGLNAMKRELGKADSPLGA